MKTNSNLFYLPIGARQAALPADILLFEADINYTTIHFTNGKKIIVAKTIKQFEEQFRQHNFFRIHKAYLVNMAFVDYLSEQEHFLKLMNKREVAVSRRRLYDVKKFLLQKEYQLYEPLLHKI
jgi:DNA-binding LytR/AlgR family response regulator